MKVLAITEQRDGALRKVSHEVIAAARKLADASGGTVDAVVFGGLAEEVAEGAGRGDLGKRLPCHLLAFGGGHGGAHASRSSATRRSTAAIFDPWLRFG